MADNKTLPAKAPKKDASYSGNMSLSVALNPEQGLNRYLSEIRKFPMLEKDEEFRLAKNWVEHGDTEAAEKMVTSHLRLVAKIAMGYRGYGLPIGEVISEGNVGLMQAVKKFDPDKGFRLSTYAMWWIRAAIQEYVLRSWSLVKMGTTAAQKKLFFNLRRMKGEMKALEDGDLKPEHLEQIATKLNVKEKEVNDMNRRMSYGGDSSLNVTIGSEDGSSEWQDWLEDDTDSQEHTLGESQEYDARMELLGDAMADLNEREQHIIRERRLSDSPKTLEELAVIYGVSRERIRQIEARAFEKLQEAMLKAAEPALIEG
ncbi:RNA polymerase sigma factor RpoH [Fretibacter rubidus]|uniref:RNA polymerase sigma factor RpoH n=1 Tax=Fretibacter rubidus TaxID=570162 RepID=UPI00352B46CC